MLYILKQIVGFFFCNAKYLVKHIDKRDKGQMGKMVGRLYNTRPNLSIVYLFFHFYQSKCPSICISAWHFFTYMIYYCC